MKFYYHPLRSDRRRAFVYYPVNFSAIPVRPKDRSVSVSADRQTVGLTFTVPNCLSSMQARDSHRVYMWMNSSLIKPEPCRSIFAVRKRVVPVAQVFLARGPARPPSTDNKYAANSYKQRADYVFRSPRSHTRSSKDQVKRIHEHHFMLLVTANNFIIKA